MNAIQKTCRDTRYHILTRSVKIEQKAFPKNTVYTRFGGALYICDRFPNYKGDAQNVTLRIWVYDGNSISPQWERMIISAKSENVCESKLARKLWIAHLENDHVQAKPIKEKKSVNFSQAERMMQSCIRKKKSGGSGSRLIPGAEENDFNNVLEWREHSSYAQWEFKGDASMVAISARYQKETVKEKDYTLPIYGTVSTIYTK